MPRNFRFRKKKRKPLVKSDSLTASFPSSDNPPSTDKLKNHDDDEYGDPAYSSYDPEAIRLTTFNDTYSEASTVQVDAYDGNSPYVEVRASVPNHDDPDLPQNTIRMWVIGFSLTTGATVLNTLFFTHDPPYIVSPYLVIVLAWPVGRLWEKFVPNVWGLNPGVFSLKEHALISIVASAGTMNLASDTVISLVYFSKRDPLGSNLIFVTLLTWGASLLGMAIAGPLKRLMVDPPSMVWPGQLVTVTLLSSIHIKWNHVANGWRITRKKFFITATVVCGVYSFFVHLFMRFLQKFAFACWISPENYVINQLFGTVTGAGIFPITFDWSMVSGFLISPLVPPARVFANAGMAVVIFIWLISTGVHYSDIWWGRHVPFADSKIYDRYGKLYNIYKIMSDKLVLDDTKYQNYSPVFISTVRVMKFGTGLAAAMAILIQTLLFDRKRLISGFKKTPDDIHYALMRKYKSIPLWWYSIVLAMALAVIYISTCAFGTGVRAWYPVVAIFISVIYMIPIASVTASTAITVNLSSLVTLITGYMDPGNALGMTMLKNWTVAALIGGVEYVSALKFGHYTKLQPRLVFIVWIVAVLWCGVLQMIVVLKIRPHVTSDCHDDGIQGLSCMESQSYFTESIVWGIVGSKRMMELYGDILHFLWIGAVLPILAWVWLKKRPRSKLRVVHWPLFFYAMAKIPPASPYNYSCWVLVGIIFSHWVRRYWHSWWAKYCYTLSVALDFGSSMMELAIFSAIVGAAYNGPKWWGNDGFLNNIDGRREPMIKTPEGGTFGPSNW